MYYFFLFPLLLTLGYVNQLGLNTPEVEECYDNFLNEQKEVSDNALKNCAGVIESAIGKVHKATYEETLPNSVTDVRPSTISSSLRVKLIPEHGTSERDSWC